MKRVQRRPSGLESDAVRSASILAVALSAWAVAGSAYAQTPPDEGTVEELVVTAQRRAQALSTVPVSIQAETGEALERQGINDAKDLFKISPSIQVIGGSSSGSSGIKIRGIGNPGLGEGIEPSAGVMIDGVYAGYSGSSLADLYDVARVEVLRGPQGTLFGKNATAGLVSVTSNLPTREFEANLRARHLFAFDETLFSGAVSGPISDKFSLRLAGFTRSRRDGALNLVVTGQTEGQLERRGGRGGVSYQDDTWDGTLLVEYLDDKTYCCARVVSALNSDPRTYTGRTPTVMIPLLAKHNIRLRTHSQKSTVAARAMADRKTVGHRS